MILSWCSYDILRNVCIFFWLSYDRLMIVLRCVLWYSYDCLTLLFPAMEKGRSHDVIDMDTGGSSGSSGGKHHPRGLRKRLCFYAGAKYLGIFNNVRWKIAPPVDKPFDSILDTFRTMRDQVQQCETYIIICLIIRCLIINHNAIICIFLRYAYYAL